MAPSYISTCVDIKQEDLLCRLKKFKTVNSFVEGGEICEEEAELVLHLIWLVAAL